LQVIRRRARHWLAIARHAVAACLLLLSQNNLCYYFWY